MVAKKDLARMHLSCGLFQPFMCCSGPLALRQSSGRRTSKAKMTQLQKMTILRRACRLFDVTARQKPYPSNREQFLAAVTVDNRNLSGGVITQCIQETCSHRTATAEDIPEEQLCRSTCSTGYRVSSASTKHSACLSERVRF